MHQRKTTAKYSRENILLIIKAKTYCAKFTVTVNACATSDDFLRLKINMREKEITELENDKKFLKTKENEIEARSVLDEKLETLLHQYFIPIKK